MLKRRTRLFPGPSEGPVVEMEARPAHVDAVLMYAQRGHGKRSSYYSDYTFGRLDEGEEDDELVPVGKAYFGFTDDELSQIDRFIRSNTIDNFGPVRHVAHEPARAGAGSGLRRPAAFDPPPIRRRHAFPPHQPTALGQAAAEADRLEPWNGCENPSAPPAAGSD